MIKLNDIYSIDSEDYMNVKLIQKVSKKDNPDEFSDKTIGYFPSIESAFNAFVTRYSNENMENITRLDKIVREIKKIKKTINL